MHFERGLTGRSGNCVIAATTGKQCRRCYDYSRRAGEE